jgi:hypothetical protein
MLGPDVTSFIGIDLVWSTDVNHTRVAVLQGNQVGVELASLSIGLTTRVVFREPLPSTPQVAPQRQAGDIPEVGLVAV